MPEFKLPSDMPRWNKSQLYEYCEKAFGVELSGSKIEMQRTIERLAEEASNRPTVPADADAEKPAAEVQPEVAPAKVEREIRVEVVPPEQPPEPEVNAADISLAPTAFDVENPPITLSNMPGQHPAHGKHVKYLYNPQTGTAFVASPALIQFGKDLIPITREQYDAVSAKMEREQPKPRR